MLQFINTVAFERFWIFPALLRFFPVRNGERKELINCLGKKRYVSVAHLADAAHRQVSVDTVFYELKH